MIKLNSTGKYIVIPGVDTMLNFTYLHYKFVVYWKGDCLYFRVLYRDMPYKVLIKLFAVPNNDSVLRYVAAFYATDNSRYCNSSLSKYAFVTLYFYLKGSQMIGPVAIMRPNIFNISVPGVLKPYIPLILMGIVLGFALSYNLRRMLAGFVAVVGFSGFLCGLFGVANPLLNLVYFLCILVLVLFIGYIVYTAPER